MTERERPHVLMLFVDGVGIGKKSSVTNPFFASRYRTLEKLTGGVIPHLREAHSSGMLSTTIPLNTTLGVRGLPQSGTGQAALLTGINAPKLIGKHFGPYPGKKLTTTIARQSIFRILQSEGKTTYYANAFPQVYFDHLKAHPKRIPAIALGWMTAGNRLNDSVRLATGRALSADITGEGWGTLGYPHMPVLSPFEGGRRLVELTREFDFVLYEYYFTDYAGHKRSMEEAIHVLSMIDQLIEGILDTLDFKSTLVLLTSDHGNVEDLSTKSHTRNPVPLVAIGGYHRRFCSALTDLTHVTPAIIEYMR